MNVLYFVDDRAHEGFIKTLVECIAESESLPRDSISHDVRSGRGGSRGIVELKEFFNDTMCYSPSEVDMLVTVIDGNCKGFAKRLDQVGAQVPPNHPLKDRIVYCIPDPHIERWYLVDQRAFKRGVGTDVVPSLPPSKCDQDFYKNLLSHALMDAE